MFKTFDFDTGEYTVKKIKNIEPCIHCGYGKGGIYKIKYGDKEKTIYKWNACLTYESEEKEVVSDGNGGYKTVSETDISDELTEKDSDYEYDEIKKMCGCECEETYLVIYRMKARHFNDIKYTERFKGCKICNKEKYQKEYTNTCNLM